MFSYARALALFLLALAPVVPPLLAVPAEAAESGSASFRNTRSAVNAGGRRKSSASYREDGSAGGLALTTAASAGYLGRSGLAAAYHYPSRVTDLWGSSTAATTEVYLQWTTPGNDGFELSTPGAYVVRYSSLAAESPALSDAKFNAATVVTPAPPAAQVKGSRLTMTVAGLRSGVTYYFALKTAERDGTRSVLSAGATAQTVAPLGCALVRNVHKVDGPYTTIQSAVNALPQSLPGHSCVIVRDAATYAEQVTVQGFVNSGSSISIFTDPAVGARAVVDPPSASTGAFVIRNASINVTNIDIRPTDKAVDASYGVFASSAIVRITSVTVDASGSPANKITLAGLRLTSWSSVDLSLVQVGAAHGLHIDSGESVGVDRSSFSAESAAHRAVYAYGAWGTVIDRSHASNTVGAAAVFDFAGLNTVSRSTVVSSAAGGTALYFYQSASNTVTQSSLRATDGWALAFWGGAHFNLVSQSTMNGAGATYGGVTMDGATGTVITQSYAYNPTGNAAFIYGSSSCTVSLSTMVSGGGAGYSGLALNSSSSNTVTRSWLQSGNGWGLNLYNALGTSVSLSTMIGSGSGYNGVSINTSTGTVLTRSYIYNPTGIGLSLYSASSNTVSLSTMVSGAAGYSAFDLNVSSWNTISRVYAYNPAGPAGNLYQARFNTLSLSTFVSGAPAETALIIQRGSDNSFDAGYVQASVSNGIAIIDGETRSVVSRSTAVCAGAACSAMYFWRAATNTITQSWALAPAGYAVGVWESTRNVVSLSTMVSASADHPALYIEASSTNTVLNSYAQGSTAAVVAASTGTVFGGMAFVAVDAGGSGLALTGGSVGLTLATSTMRAPASGRGLALDAGNRGVVAIGSVTFTDSGRGIQISTQSAGFALAIDSITFRNLASGATAIHFLGGTFVSTITLADFEDATVGANVVGAPLALASRVTMRSFNGVRSGPTFENDPNSLVDWVGVVPPDPVALWFVGMSSAGLTYATTGAEGYTVQASTRADFASWVSVSSTVFGAQDRLTVLPLMPNTTYFLRAGALYNGTTMYSATVITTATLSQLVTGTTVYAIHLTSMVVNWVPLAAVPPGVSSMSAQGYILQASSMTDFTPLWSSSATPNVELSTLTIEGLRGGVTYYFRVGSLNWNNVPHFAGAVSTLMPVQLGVELTTHTISVPGLTNLNTTVLITTSVIVSNTGNVKETYWVRATTVSAGSPWSIGATQGIDRYVLSMLINGGEPLAGDFGAEDRLADPEAACGAAVFAFGGDCVQVPVGGTRTLWFKLDTPIVTSTNMSQDIRIYVRAVRDPDPDPNP